MPVLVACPSCSVHVRADEPRCPSCHRPLRDSGGRIGRTAGALLMGLSLGACGDNKDDGDSSASSITAQPDYGVPATEGEPEYGVVSTGESTTGGESSSGDESSSSSGDTGGTTSVGEPDYGVPGTTGG